MDERQQQIRERAGLEESRLNQDFIDFISKYGTPMLVVLALVAAGYWGWDKFEKNERTKIDEAFAQFTSTSESPNPSPESLKGIADEFGKVKAVGVLAKLEAADAYMRAVRRGVQSGKELKQDGSLDKPEDALSDSERTEYLNQAGELYKAVYEQCGSNQSRMPLTLGALFGLAAVAESKQEYDAAKARYEEIVRLTQDNTFSRDALIAKHRIEQLGALKDLPKLYAKTELPKLESDEPAPLALPPGVTVDPTAGPPTQPPSGPAGPPAPPANPPTNPPATGGEGATPAPAPATTTPASTPAPTTPPPK